MYLFPNKSHWSEKSFDGGKKCRSLFKHLWEIRTIKYNMVIGRRYRAFRENEKVWNNSQNISI